MTRAFRPFALLLLTLAATLGGCVSQTPIADRHFGEAALAARAQQTLDPDASAAPPTVAGLDGKAARHALERYHDSFKTPPKPVNVFNIGVGQQDD